MKDIFAIFLDIDGTLMEHGKPVDPVPIEIPPYNIEMINKVRALGHKVFINTGRGYAFIPDVVLKSGLFDGYISGNGSHISVGDRLIYNNPIPHAILDEIFDYVKEKDKPCRFQGPVKKLAYDRERDLSPVWCNVESKEELFERLGNDCISKITVDRRFSDDLADFISKRLNLFRGGDYGEAAMPGCDKATGISRVIEYLDIPRENTIAMGDSFNDLEMLMYAAISVATANADERVKALCTYVTDSDVSGGVGKALQRIFFE